MTTKLKRRTAKKKLGNLGQAAHPPIYEVTYPLRAVVIGTDDAPAAVEAIDGLLLAVGSDRVVMELQTGLLSTGRLLLGVEDHGGDFVFSTVELTSQSEAAGLLHLKCDFAHGARDILRSQNLIPHLNAETKRYETTLSAHVLRQWTDLEVLRPRLVDHVLCCPACGGVASFRQACRGCGSVRTTPGRMIHHFACAHVAPLADFEQAAGLTCPKCLTKNLVIGADFEYLHGVHLCEDCAWTDMQLAMVGECMACQLRMPRELAHQQELIAYDVDRLDPLAIIDSV